MLFIFIIICLSKTAFIYKYCRDGMDELTSEFNKVAGGDLGGEVCKVLESINPFFSFFNNLINCISIFLINAFMSN